MGGQICIMCISETGTVPAPLRAAAQRASGWDIICTSPSPDCLGAGMYDLVVLYGIGAVRCCSGYLSRCSDQHPVIAVSDEPICIANRSVYVLPTRDASATTLFHLIQTSMKGGSLLRESEGALSRSWSVLDTIDTQVWSFDVASQTYVDMNEARRRFIGTRARSMKMSDALNHADADSCMSSYNLAMQTGHPVSKKQWMPNAAGEMRLLHIRKYPIRGSDGTLSHVVCTADDVTRQELTKRELIESRERFRSLVDHIPIALWEEDYSGVKRELEALIQREGIMDIAQYLKSHPETVSALVRKVRILSINAAGLLMYGASDLDEYISSLDEVFSEQSLQMFSRALCAIAAGGTQVSGDDVNFSLDGRRMDVYVTWTVVPGHEETYDQVLVSDLDITSQKDIERMLRQQKEELSAFAHTLAHDMRGPLSSILAHAELARGERPSDDIDAIIRRARELGTLVNATLASALVGFDAQQGSCDNVASIIAGIAEDVVPDTISVNIDEIPPLPMGEVHCRQVFFNLLHNAVVHARPSSIHVKYQHISNMHEIRICDNGRGIAPERIESIFKKGYTTDIDGHGVGLSIVRHIVEQYGGSIVARSRDGRGACFILLLPAK